MLTTFRNLDDAKKRIVIIIFAVAFVAVLFIVGFFMRGDGKPIEKVETPYETSASPTATASPTDATMKPSETPRPTPTGPGSEIIYGETSLSVDEQQAVQSIAKDSVLAYFLNTKGESLDSRNARLNPYFNKESGVYEDKSFGESFNIPALDTNNYVISKGSIDYVDPAGGNETLYKVVVGVTYRMQVNEQDKVPQVLERNAVYTLLLSKTSGTWKVTSLNTNQ